jgi:putative ABC transport system ATP-binding protein
VIQVSAPHDNFEPSPLAQTTYAIDMRNLCFSYRKNDPNIIDIPHWQVLCGEHLFIRGPSGAGKSTLLNLLAGILKPTAGSIVVLGQDIGQFNSRRRDQFRAAHIGLVFQQFNLLPYLNVFDNIQLAAHFNGQPKATTQARFHDLAEALQLDQTLFKKNAAELSVGQQQRVAILRALINDPEIIIADEPTSSLDADRRDAFMQLLLQQVQRTNKTLIFVSHDQSLSRHFSATVDLVDLNQASARVMSSC